MKVQEMTGVLLGPLLKENNGISMIFQYIVLSVFTYNNHIVSSLSAYRSTEHMLRTIIHLFHSFDLFKNGVVLILVN